MPERNTLLHALVGAVVSVVLTFLLLSPVLGGAVAGYLNRRNGVRVGAVSGLFAAVPVVVVALVLGSFSFGLRSGGVVGFTNVFLVFLFAFGVVYTVGLSAFGGFIGVYLADEFAGSPV